MPCPCQALGIDLSRYRYVVMVLPSNTTRTRCNFGGLAAQSCSNGCYAFINVSGLGSARGEGRNAQQHTRHVLPGSMNGAPHLRKLHLLCDCRVALQGTWAPTSMRLDTTWVSPHNVPLCVGHSWHASFYHHQVEPASCTPCIACLQTGLRPSVSSTSGSCWRP